MAKLDRAIAGLEQVTIAGTGLLGGSIGLALRAAGFRGRIVGVGRRPETLDRAVRMGCIDAGMTDLSQAVKAGEASGGSQLVILATPLSAFAGLIEQLKTVEVDGLVITDVGSVKRGIAELARKHLRRPQRFVGSHPMAGGEQQGPEHARADLFEGRPCVITREPGDDADAVAVVEALWRTLGMNIHYMDVDEHDQQAALISHLPHAAAVLLVELAAKRGGMSIASTGFRDTTRVASGDARVWADIFSANRAAVVDALDGFAESLAAFRAMVERGDDDQIHAMLTDAKLARDSWISGEADITGQ